MHPNFEDWIYTNEVVKRSAQTKLSRLRRIESAYGDLDALYDGDEFEGLIQELSYTTDDARSDHPNPSRLEIDGNLYDNLASYRSAVRRYARFRRESGSIRKGDA